MCEAISRLEYFLFEIPEGYACYQLTAGEDYYVVIPADAPPTGVAQLGERFLQQEGFYLQRIKGEKYELRRMILGGC